MSCTATDSAAAPGVIWSLYLVRMASGALYCGITTKVERRFAEHCAGGPKCARALRGRGPLTLAFACEVGSHSRALQLEYRVKKLPRKEKERLLRGERELPLIG